MCMPIDKCVCIAFPIAKQLIASPLPLKLCQCVCVCVCVCELPVRYLSLCVFVIVVGHARRRVKRESITARCKAA